LAQRSKKKNWKKNQNTGINASEVTLLAHSRLFKPHGMQLKSQVMQISDKKKVLLALACVDSYTVLTEHSTTRIRQEARAEQSRAEQARSLFFLLRGVGDETPSHVVTD
jgi:hypothetical protein